MELYKDEDLLNKGNFKDNGQGDKIELISNYKVTNDSSIYKLYMWIDGANFNNPEAMQNQIFKFILSADATDLSPALKTLTKLGLYENNDSPNFDKTAQASCGNAETCETTNGIYATEDELGISYYFRGAVENNYVKFAGFYWRIIKINEDGIIRIKDIMITLQMQYIVMIEVYLVEQG